MSTPIAFALPAQTSIKVPNMGQTVVIIAEPFTPNATFIEQHRGQISAMVRQQLAAVILA